MRMIRLTLFAAFMIALCAASSAQEAPPTEEPPPPALESKTYDLTGLVDTDIPAKLPDLLSPDRVLSGSANSSEEFTWSVRNYRGGARCWSSADEAMQFVLTFCTTGEPGNCQSDSLDNQRVTLTCDEELHRRVAWTLETLKAAATVRVKLRAFALPPGTGPTLLNAAEAEKTSQGAVLLGAVSGQLGETLLVQKCKPAEFIQGYEIAPDSKCSLLHASLNAGRELVAGALLLPDGRLWLQAWSSQLDLHELREVRSSCGKLECPRVRYSYVPISALLENNGAAIIDEGSFGRTLLVCSVEGALPNRTLDCGTRTTLGLVNVTSTLTGEFPRLPWLAGGALAEVKLGINHAFSDDSPSPCVLSGATIEIATRLSYESQVLGAIVPLGPYLGVRITEPEGDSGSSAEEFETARKLLSETLKGISAGPKAIELHVQAWRVKTVPTAFVQGNATPKDAQALGAPTYERHVQAISGYVLGLADLEMAALICGDGSTPEIGVAAWGSQLEWQARETAAGTEIALRFGVVEGERKLKSVEESGMVKFERATRMPTQTEINGTLPAKGLLSTVVPDGDGYVILAVQRVR
jgi:hypothetical protein